MQDRAHRQYAGGMIRGIMASRACKPSTQSEAASSGMRNSRLLGSPPLSLREMTTAARCSSLLASSCTLPNRAASRLDALP
eukprot:5394635-Prymnesium_polylepis.1